MLSSARLLVLLQCCLTGSLLDLFCCSDMTVWCNQVTQGLMSYQTFE